MTRLLLVMLLVTPFVPGQGRGGGGGGGGSGAPPMQTRDPTPLDQFVDKMRLSEQQVPEVQRILQGAAVEATPVSDELVRLRMQMLDLDLAGKTDGLQAVLDQYTAASARMTGVEIKAMGTVRTVLKSGQLSRIGEGFAVIGGVFNAPTPKGRPAGGRGGVQ